MKIQLPYNFNENLGNLMRRSGYAVFNDPNTGQTSYTKRLSRDFYPRFHVYIETNKDNFQFINLHLDQKKPSYAGAHAHNADYDGDRVEQEANLLQGMIKNQQDNESQKKPLESKKHWFDIFNK